MKVVALLAALLMAPVAHGAILTWPGPAPCNASLANCISNADPGDTVRVATSSVDEEVFFANKSLTLEAAPGYLPRFEDDWGIFINYTDGGSHNVTIRGFQFTTGRIGLIHTDGEATVLIERNRFDATGGDNPAINLTSDADTNGADFDYTVRFNTIRDNSSFVGAIRMEGSGFGSRSTQGVIEGNHLSLRADNSDGIAVQRSNGLGIFQTRIFGNTIESAGSSGILVLNSAELGGISAYVYSNLVYHRDTRDRTGRAISLRGFSSAITGIVVNNSLLAHETGLEVFQQSPGTVDATVANNIVARNAVAWMIDDEASFSEHHNLFHANDQEPDSIDASSIMADPLFHPNLPGRLRAGSPAIDAGDNAATSSLPALDARGHHRYIGSAAGGQSAITDIGAVEFGDQWLMARKPTSSLNNFVVNSPFLDERPDQYPQITPLWNPYGEGGIYNDANEGIYYADDEWRIFNQNPLEAMPRGAAFWVFVPDFSVATQSHSTSSAANTTQLDWGAANDKPERILAVTQHWNRSGSGVYNNHPIGVFYVFGHWNIANLDGDDIPSGADFNLYIQDPSQNAFEHIARGANIQGNWTRLRHPLLDGNPCARMQVTQSASQSVFNARPIGVWYTGTHWAIFNQDEEAMPENAAFHVIVDGDSLGCGLFSDRFSAGGF